MSAKPIRPMPELRKDEFDLEADPRGLYGRATRKGSRRRLHYVLLARAIWRRHPDGPATFDRFAIYTDCASWLISAELHRDPTDDPTCDYCSWALKRWNAQQRASTSAPELVDF